MLFLFKLIISIFCRKIHSPVDEEFFFKKMLICGKELFISIAFCHHPSIIVEKMNYNQFFIDGNQWYLHSLNS